jgi:hypothetical protein
MARPSLSEWLDRRTCYSGKHSEPIYSTANSLTPLRAPHTRPGTVNYPRYMHVQPWTPMSFPTGSTTSVSGPFHQDSSFTCETLSQTPQLTQTPGTGGDMAKQGSVSNFIVLLWLSGEPLSSKIWPLPTDAKRKLQTSCLLPSNQPACYDLNEMAPRGSS